MKKNNIFQDMTLLLHDNVFPSITTSLQEMGMEYCHITILPEFSMTFFNHLRIDWPFRAVELAKENDKHVVILSIRYDGQISLSSNFNIINGIIYLQNTIVFSENISEFFKLKFENNFLFHISDQFSQRAAQFLQDRNIAYQLLDRMAEIRPLLKRNVLVEKLQKNY